MPKVTQLSVNGRRGKRPLAGTKRLLRWLASRTYSCTPLATIGRTVANRYAWQSPASHAPFPLRRRPLPVCQIFLYHRINDEGDPFLGGLPVKTFAAQMEYVARNFPLLTLDQVSREEFPGGHSYYIAVTFDDGYRDNFTCATPILQRFGIPATVFLATGFIDSGELPWYDQVRLAFKSSSQSYLSLRELGGPEGRLGDLPSRLWLLERTLTWLRAQPRSECLQAIDELFRKLGVSSQLQLSNQMLGWHEIRQMSKSNIVFGAHTVNHPALSQISDAELMQELGGSKRTIEDRLQLPVSHFAYPFGQSSDFTAKVKKSVPEAGFKTAVTTIRGLNDRSTDRFELRRFTPWESDWALFRMQLDWFRFQYQDVTEKERNQSEHSRETSVVES